MRKMQFWTARTTTVVALLVIMTLQTTTSVQLHLQHVFHRHAGAREHRVGRHERMVATVTSLRGGADVDDASSSSAGPPPAPPASASMEGTCTIIVSTSVGSAFLDKKKRLTVPRNSTVAELKSLIEKKFPGCPPAALQRLFSGVRPLHDDDVIGNVTSTSAAAVSAAGAAPTPLLLDMMSGVGVYNKTLSITQALEAHAASVVQQAYVGAKFREFCAGTGTAAAGGGSGGEEAVVESSFYRDMFERVNRTLYETYADDIAAALELEKEPETIGDDTKAWRSPTRTEARPLVAALAKEFDLNVKGIRSFVYYSILLAIFALYGTSSPAAGQFLILMVPVLWVSKLRQLRLLLKIVQYLVLPIIPSLDFLMPLLPAPYQVIAVETSRMSGDIVGGPVLPQAKGSRQKVAATEEDDEEEGGDYEEDRDSAGAGEGAEADEEADGEAEGEEEPLDDADVNDDDDDDA